MATYWVAEDGDDEDAGSYAAPWATLQHAADSAGTDGDVVYVRSGTYDERVDIDTNSGSEGSPITIAMWWADETRPICKGFAVSGVSWVRLIGFEITHDDDSYYNGIQIGANVAHLDILRCYVHNVQRACIQWASTTVTYLRISDNEMSYAHHIPVEGGEVGGYHAVNGAGGSGHVVEYNHAHHLGDYMNINSGPALIRNNWLEDYQDSYFPDAGEENHVDFFQPCGASGYGYPCTYHVYESNIGGDNLESNSHCIIQQTDSDDDHHMMYRGNVFYRLGSGMGELSGTNYTALLNNTCHDSCKENPVAGGIFVYFDRSREPVGTFCFNNLFSVSGDEAFTVQDGFVTPVVEYNWGYDLAAHASYVGDDDPLFVNALSDWHLQVTSPVIDEGRALTTVATANGSGTEFDVAAGTGWLIFDGMGVVDGDLIAVGTGDPVRVTDVTTDTITVASSISWTQGDGVYWRSKQALDIGAYEYRASYAYDVTLSVASNGTITATPTVPALVRDVEFWIDGLPVARDYDSPYTHAWNLAGLSGQHLIEVRAHALYADPDLWQEADRTVTVADGAVTDGTGDLYEITYEANGAVTGSVPTDTNDYAASASVTALGNTGALAKTGYYFRGWNTAADGSGTHYAPGATFSMPAENETLYAEWHTLFAWVKG